MSLVLILSFLLFFLISFFKKNKWVSIMISIHLLSVALGLLVDYHMNDSALGFLYALLICLYLYMIIAPWKDLKPLSFNIIQNNYGKNLKTYSNVVIYIGIFATLFFIPVIIVLYSMNIDADYFRTGGGMDVFFHSSAFPIPFKVFILITFIANVSLLALPLHFYYLSQGAKKMAFLAFLASLAYVMRGLCSFSRSILLQYIVLYGMLFLLFYKQIDKKSLSFMKIIVVIGVFAVIINFLAISNDRFKEGYSVNQTEYYQNKYKYVDDPVVVSYLDYLSQGYYNAHDLLMMYDGHTFKGQTTFNEILVLLNQYFGFPFSSYEYKQLREKLWPGRWWETFNGYVGYVVYDFGIIGSFIVTLMYYIFIKRNCRKYLKSKLNISQFTWLVLFLQVPLHSIFYSAYGGLVIPCLFFLVMDNIFTVRHSKKKSVICQ